MTLLKPVSQRLARLPGPHLRPEHLPRRVEMLPRDGRLDEARRGRRRALAVGRGQLHPRRLAVDPCRLVDQRRLVGLAGVADVDRRRATSRRRPPPIRRSRTGGGGTAATRAGLSSLLEYRLPGDGASRRRRCSPSRSARAAMTAAPTLFTSHLPVALDEIHLEEQAADFAPGFGSSATWICASFGIREVDLHRRVLDRVDRIRDDSDVARVPGLQRLALADLLGDERVGLRQVLARDGGLDEAARDLGRLRRQLDGGRARPTGRPPAC